MTDPAGKILVVLPTRGRRELLARCVKTFTETTDTADLLVVIDDDDEGTYEGLEFPPGVRTQVIPRLPLAAKNNRIAVAEAPSYRAVIIVGNDQTFDTRHWDTILTAELDRMGGSGIVYPDTKRRRDIGEICLISSDIILALGWFSEPSLKHYWADNVIDDIGRAAGCLKFCPDAVIEHHHYSVDPGTPYDAVYRYGESHGGHDAQAYRAWRQDRMDADVATVRKLLASKGLGFTLTLKTGNGVKVA